MTRFKIKSILCSIGLIGVWSIIFYDVQASSARQAEIQKQAEDLVDKQTKNLVDKQTKKITNKLNSKKKPNTEDELANDDEESVDNSQEDDADGIDDESKKKSTESKITIQTEIRKSWDLIVEALKPRQDRSVQISAIKKIATESIDEKFKEKALKIIKDIEDATKDQKLLAGLALYKVMSENVQEKFKNGSQIPLSALSKFQKLLKDNKKISKHNSDLWDVWLIQKVEKIVESAEGREDAFKKITELFNKIEAIKEDLFQETSFYQDVVSKKYKDSIEETKNKESILPMVFQKFKDNLSEKQIKDYKKSSKSEYTKWQTIKKEIEPKDPKDPFIVTQTKKKVEEDDQEEE